MPAIKVIGRMAASYTQERAMPAISCSTLAQRQRDTNNQPPTLSVAGLDAAAVHMNRVGGDRQTQSVSTAAAIPGFLYPVERFEDFLQFTLGYAAAKVPYFQAHTRFSFVNDQVQ